MNLTEEKVIEKFKDHDFWVMANRDGFPHPSARKLDIRKLDLSPFSSLDIFKDRTYYAHTIDSSVLSFLHMSGSQFQDDINVCKFEGSNLSNCKFGPIKISSSFFKGANFSNSEFHQTIFSNCNFDSATFDNCNFLGCKFLNCRMDNASARMSSFEATSFEKCEVLFVDFVGSSFIRTYVNRNSIWILCKFYESGEHEPTFDKFKVSDSIFYTGYNFLYHLENEKVAFKNVRMPDYCFTAQYYKNKI